MSTKLIRSTLIASLCLIATPLARADTWIITDGPQAGTILSTDGNGSTDVSWGKNHLFGANGYITWDAQGNYSFTGELNGVSHANAGSVLKLDGDLAPLGQFVDALNGAINVILGGRWGATNAPNGASAIQDLCTAAELIDALKSMIDDKVSGKKQRAKLKKKADKLKRRLLTAKALLGLAAEAPGQAEKLVKANSKKLRSKVKSFGKSLMKALTR